MSLPEFFAFPRMLRMLGLLCLLVLVVTTLFVVADSCANANRYLTHVINQLVTVDSILVLKPKTCQEYCGLQTAECYASLSLACRFSLLCDHSIS